MENPLKKYLDEENITPSELSDKLMISISTVYSWLRGDTVPSKGNLRNLAREMGIKTIKLQFRYREWEKQRTNNSGEGAEGVRKQEEEDTKKEKSSEEITSNIKEEE